MIHLLVVVVAGVDVLVTIFKTCSPADFIVVDAVEAMADAAVVAAPNTFPECLRVCLRMTSEIFQKIHYIVIALTTSLFLYYKIIFPTKSYFRVRSHRTLPEDTSRGSR